MWVNGVLLNGEKAKVCRSTKKHAQCDIVDMCNGVNASCVDYTVPAGTTCSYVDVPFLRAVGGCGGLQHLLNSLFAMQMDAFNSTHEHKWYR
jgi:hypothetical protein